MREPEIRVTHHASRCPPGAELAYTRPQTVSLSSYLLSHRAALFRTGCPRVFQARTHAVRNIRNTNTLTPQNTCALECSSIIVRTHGTDNAAKEKTMVNFIA